LAKKIPMRMCVSCREMQPKKELVRIVRTPEGNVLLDTTGRANGRGAYLCKKSACLEKAIKSRALERALETKIEPETYDTLRTQFAGYHEQQAD
jgi:uncharacterized protein